MGLAAIGAKERRDSPLLHSIGVDVVVADRLTLKQYPTVLFLMHRLLTEYRVIQESLQNGEAPELCMLQPVSESDLYVWQCKLQGPPDTPYEGHTFNLQLVCPPDYPQSPPTAHFEPYRMPHCNVDWQSGRVCLDILNEDHWSPVWTLLAVARAIHVLLQRPEPDSPLNVDISNLLRAGDQNAYRGLVNYLLHVP